MYKLSDLFSVLPALAVKVAIADPARPGRPPAWSSTYFCGRYTWKNENTTGLGAVRYARVLIYRNKSTYPAPRSTLSSICRKRSTIRPSQRSKACMHHTLPRAGGVMSSTIYTARCVLQTKNQNVSRHKEKLPPLYRQLLISLTTNSSGDGERSDYICQSYLSQMQHHSGRERWWWCCWW